MNHTTPSAEIATQKLQSELISNEPVAGVIPSSPPPAGDERTSIEDHRPHGARESLYGTAPFVVISRYAHLSKLIGSKVVVDESCERGVIVGLWTSNDGTPEMVVLKTSGRFRRVGLERVTVVGPVANNSRS
jgi:hypothetical protein